MKRNYKKLMLVAFFVAMLTQTIHAQVGRGALGIGLSLGANTMRSDWTTVDVGVGGAADVSYSFGKGWALVSSLGADQYTGKIGSNQQVASTIFHASIGLSYEFLRDKPVDPFIFVSSGWMLYTPRKVGGAAMYNGQYPPYDIFVSGGLGLDCYVNESWSVIITAEGSYLGTDNADGVVKGSNDITGRVSVGLRYYLFDRSTVEKIVKSVEKRFEE